MSDPQSERQPADRPTAHRQGARERIAGAVSARMRSARGASTGWRIAVPLVFAVAGTLFVTSAVSSGGTDLRAGRYDDLPGLAQAEARQVEQLRQRQVSLAADVDELSTGLADGAVSGAEAEVERYAGPAGLQAVHGPGVTVTLDDAPEEALALVPDDKVNNLVVHEQDIQAVVNALWSGGAEAMTIQGQRVISTTGIKCVGNAVVLHDVPYAPPYVISAIGPTDSMLTSLDQSPYIGFYLDAVDDYDLGWDVQTESDIVAPAYEGSTELSHARPDVVPDSTTGSSSDDRT